MFECNFGGRVFTVAHKRVEEPDIKKYYKHIHPFCELLLVISGEMEFNTDGKIFALKPYDLAIIPNGVYHNISAIKPKPYENYVLDFYAGVMPEKFAKRLFSQPKTVNIKNDTVLLNFFRLFDTYHNLLDEADFARFAEMLVCEASTYLAADLNGYEAVDADKSPLVERILDEISAGITENINGEIIAKRLSFSKSYIQNIFSSQMKIGLKEYIMQKKIFAAHSDIASGASPTETAAKYGFADYSSFYRRYKKYIGVSPRGK